MGLTVSLAKKCYIWHCSCCFCSSCARRRACLSCLTFFVPVSFQCNKMPRFLCSIRLLRPIVIHCLFFTMLLFLSPSFSLWLCLSLSLLPAVAQLLLENKANVNDVANAREVTTPLHDAIRNQHLDIVLLLLRFKSNVAINSWKVCSHEPTLVG